MNKCELTVKPLFLTHKVRVRPLNLIIYDYQLRDHLINTKGLFISECKCQHSHSKMQCPFRISNYCEKCNKFNQSFFDFHHLLYHHSSEHKALYQFTCGCRHTHRPPCNRCLNCRTGLQCIVHFEFECNFTTEIFCRKCDRLTQEIPRSRMIKNHIYNVRDDLYICKRHTHTHVNSMKTCFLQSTKCCEDAILINDYNRSFHIYDSKNGKKYLVYNPSIWIDQSTNRYISWLTAIVYDLTDNDIIEKRYEKFITSSFKISNIKSYKSGGDSVIRTDLTGFLTKGIYQTSIISCTIPEDIVLIPQAIYDLSAPDYYMDYVIVKRDPSFHQTSTFAMRAIRNEDPSIQCIVIPDEIAKPLNQDCDGDKNGIYLLAKCTQPSFDRTESYSFKVAVMEMQLAYDNRLTLFGEPRYLISENNLVAMYRNRDHFNSDPFFKRTFTAGGRQMVETGCGYNRQEYQEFRKKIIAYNKEPHRNVITLQDLFGNSQKLMSIPLSGAKGSELSFQILMNNLRTSSQLTDRKDELLYQMDRYIESSKKMSNLGHNQFVMLYSIQDLIALNGNIYLNKIHFADYKKFSSAFCLMFNEASLDSFIHDLENDM